MTSPRTHIVLDSPIDPLTAVAEDGAICALLMDDQRHRPPTDALGEPSGDEPVLRALAEQLDAYFAGSLTEFDVPLRLGGTPFQAEVWRALRGIPYGRTSSYGQLAATVGRPGAARAVGLANGRNPVSIVVPCHRVIGRAGDLTGYGGGLERKRWLLDHERAHAFGQAALPGLSAAGTGL